MSDQRVDLRSHFGFHSMPFTREITVTDRWSAKLFDDTLRDLEHTVEQRMSAVLIAASGTGKTMLLRTLRDQLPEARYRVRYVKVTGLAKRDLYREFAVVAGVEPTGSYPTLIRRLQDHFQGQAEDDGLRPVLILDEAQDLRPDVLTTLRILTNFHMDSRLVLSLVLAGDSRLRPLLELQQMTPIRRRLAHCAVLRLLSRDETQQYLKHRLNIVGCRSLPFDDQALDAVYEITRGNLRAINHLCLKALDGAAQRKLDAVDTSLIAAARQQLLL